LIYKINEPEPVKQMINIEETEIEISEYPETLNVYTFKRRLYTKYCYNGGNIDPNTGCTQKTEHIKATKYDVIGCVREDKCPTGNECSPGGNCWSDNANYECFSKDISSSSPFKFEN
jgi:hypothetical protein